jgi:hypothetical protein
MFTVHCGIVIRFEQTVQFICSETTVKPSAARGPQCSVQDVVTCLNSNFAAAAAVSGTLHTLLRRGWPGPGLGTRVSDSENGGNLPWAVTSE